MENIAAGIQHHSVARARFYGCFSIVNLHQITYALNMIFGQATACPLRRCYSKVIQYVSEREMCAKTVHESLIN